MAKVAIIGASVAGLTAAVKLKQLGLDVTIFEKKRSVGGLFSKIDTPFGLCELGMHVLYVTNEQHKLLADIFGKENFIEQKGVNTDIGGCFNRTLFVDSIYPDLRGNSSLHVIMQDLLDSEKRIENVSNCLSELHQRFGQTGADVISPILEKLWKFPVENLTPESIHCYFDLRRLVVADKTRSDEMKKDPRLNELVANPLQLQPAGEVFNGRKALFFSSRSMIITEDVAKSISGLGINLVLNSDIKLFNSSLYNGSELIKDNFDACIIASPLNTLQQDLADALDNVELSIFYFKVDRSHCRPIDDYYIVCHDPHLHSTRIVNYSAYNFEKLKHLNDIIAVEVIHPVHHKPDSAIISNELMLVISGMTVIDSYELPLSLKVPIPSLTNARLLDLEVSAIRKNFEDKPLFFAGMRTDKGVFFSHHTIGAAYDAALECASKLS
ncbi:FAD/NAD(P)-binding protein [uncultured Oceanisphaera sp.]|uniref:NAD(P)-binding protein n=1 Tax=uncultured Oceanisphaera sp. TaxID=353858 RepID=UPI00260FB712|nr:FAD/NAD(P)-binding protein [uncultured Oceanisphaera sp.]